MKTPRVLFTTSLLLGYGLFTACSSGPKVYKGSSPARETQAPAPVQKPAAQQTYNYEQRAYVPNATLVPPERARAVLDAFRVANDKLGKPRYLIYVNRDLVEGSGLKLSNRTERTESARSAGVSSFEADPNAPKPEGTNPQTQVNVAVGGGNAGSAGGSTPGKGSSEQQATKVTAENTYTSTGNTAPTIADKQTTREVERLLGRPFRYAGATLADQKTAASLIADKPIDHFTVPTDEAARKDREALAKITDIVIEALITSRSSTVVTVAGDQSVSVPDIQLTAIRLSDSAILGQASSADVLGKGQYAGNLAKQYDVQDITEATALALIEDITVSAK